MSVLVQHPVFRPICGFGWRGWLLLPLAIWLTWCASGGFDLRHSLMSVCDAHWGNAWVWNVIIRKLLFASYSGTLTGVMPGPLTLVWVLLAMHLSPSPWRTWHWISVSACLVLNPWLTFELSRASVSQLGPHAWLLMRMPGMGSRAEHNSELLLPLLLELLALFLLAGRATCTFHPAMHGSRWRLAPLSLLVFGASLAAFQWWLDWPATQRTFTFNIGIWPWIGMGSAWHLTSGFLLVGGALAARQRIHHDRGARCIHCGYDLRSPPPRGVCPECGKTQPTDTAAGAAGAQPGQIQPLPAGTASAAHPNGMP